MLLSALKPKWPWLRPNILSPPYSLWVQKLHCGGIKMAGASWRNFKQDWVFGCVADLPIHHYQGEARGEPTQDTMLRDTTGGIRSLAMPVLHCPNNTSILTSEDLGRLDNSIGEFSVFMSCREVASVKVLFPRIPQILEPSGMFLSEYKIYSKKDTVHSSSVLCNTLCIVL